jgi:hypothetical protein
MGHSVAFSDLAMSAFAPIATHQRAFNIGSEVPLTPERRPNAPQQMASLFD